MSVYCMECGSEMRETIEPMKSEFRGIELAVSGIRHDHCDECDDDMIPADQLDLYEEKLLEAYRQATGLLLPSEIRALRRSLGLTQEQFQTVLGVGKTTVSRWETGRVVQLKPEDNLMRAMLDHPDIAQELIERSGIRAAQA